MKRIIHIILLVLISSGFAEAQITIERQVLGATGGDYIGTTMQVSYTVGEPMVKTTGSTTTILTQGFQQPSVVELDFDLKFYSGITPNGDDKNDVWIIENIEQFPENSVKIFNRWGEIVWKGDNYDNENVVWAGDNEGGSKMADATYFYIAEINGSVYKGWVELTR